MNENHKDILNGFGNGVRRHYINNGRIKILICETYRNNRITGSNVLKYGLEPKKFIPFVEKEILQVKDWCTTNNLEIIECDKGHITYRNSFNVICMDKYFIMELNDMNTDNEEYTFNIS